MAASQVLSVVAGVAATLALLAILSIALLNGATFRRLRPARDAAGPRPSLVPGAPSVSILIPARDEEEGIGLTVSDLRCQTREDIEIIVLDDDSSDETVARALEAAGSDHRVRVLQGAPLPEGWAGKSWACAQLAKEGRGGLLLFTDADTRWQPGALVALLHERERTAADLLTAWPTQVTRSWAERLSVPLMAFAVQGYLPVLAVHHLGTPALAAAMGQCLLFTRDGYEASGGHAAVRATVLEDVALARRVKAAGRRLRQIDGNRLISCRMYRNWPSVRDGFAKNMLAGYGSPAGLVAATFFHWLILLWPWAWLLLGALDETAWPGWPIWPLSLIGMGVTARAITAASTRQRLGDALLLPVSALLFTLIALHSARWWRAGGVRWKDRVLPGREMGRGRDP